MHPLLRTSLFAVVVAAPASAAPQDAQQYPRLPESVQRVEHETGGKVLQVQPIQRGDREVYRMKVLTPDGRVRVVQDDPRHPRDTATRTADDSVRAGLPAEDDEVRRR